MRRSSRSSTSVRVPETRLTIDLLLSWTGLEADGLMQDSAQWHDWENAVATVLQRRDATD